MEDMARGDEAGRKMTFDRNTKTFRAESPFDDPDQTIRINPSDADLFSSTIADSGRIIISGDLIEKQKDKLGPMSVYFNCWDGGDVYNLFHENHTFGAVPGTIYQTVAREEISINDFGNSFDRIRVIIQHIGQKAEGLSITGSVNTHGYVRHNAYWKNVPVQITPVRNEIFSRFEGLIETDALSDKKVLVVGLGSGGSHITLELAKSGGMNFFIMDHEPFEIGNVGRHIVGISHTGRYKTKIVAGEIKDRNPYARVQTYEEKLSGDNIGKLRTIVRQVDLGICATDDREPKLIFNRICIEENKPCIFAGAFRRAYGGQILFVHPFKSLCYQCFCMLLPDLATDQEISSREQSEYLAYTDRPVAIEPGLSNDIAPISLMVTKLAIQHLLKDKETTLRSLDDDLKASFYLWLNRREKGTQYENLHPLEFNVDGMHILRWYGIDIKRHPDCPVCGNEKNLFTKL